ncbi:uncharacterized protein C9orf40 homolog [Kryptolebias marmoratus]|uniref:uncharacterized protein C9orf40 homolog n=1 Tax=Kryptolebias marmoratus TaxID=37003 RepID=UPI0007F8A953|nr:uncharacterized protein C9orf40 homolog [Kryptolebias marmoratus]
MAKRRAENPLLLDSPGKRKLCRPLCGVDMRLESSAAPTSGAVSPPSLLALLGGRCRKRPHYFENEEKPGETSPRLMSSLCASKKLAADVSTEQVSGSFQVRRSVSCSDTSKKKEPRVDSRGSEPVRSTANDKTAEDAPVEDSIYNSFQYWRVPLPELNLSLLEDPSDDSQTKTPSKNPNDSPSDAMET